MVAFLGGVIVGAIGLFLVLDNNPKLAAKLKTVKNIVKEKIDNKKEQGIENPNLYIQNKNSKK